MDDGGDEDRVRELLNELEEVEWCVLALKPAQNERRLTGDVFSS